MKRQKVDSSWDWGKPFNLADCQKEFGWTDTDWMIGIDEAGRGPVVGPMVYGGFACRVRDHAQLVELGVNDSKALTDEKRKSIRAGILDAENSEEIFLHDCRDLHADEISRQQLARTPISLNKISHSAAIDIISALQKRIPEGEKTVALFVDIVGPQETYLRKLQAEFAGVTIVVRSKADAIFPVTGGASIMAKVQRDNYIESFPAQLPSGLRMTGDVGSGYPADPATKTWLQRNTHRLFVLPNVARFDWQPVKDIASERCVPVSWTYDGLDQPEAFGEGRKRKRWQFFQEMYVTHPKAF